ncbi:MAG: hypothetical protein ACRDRH_17155 [Pseudonocardia sp.]
MSSFAPSISGGTALPIAPQARGGHQALADERLVEIDAQELFTDGWERRATG